MKEFISSVRFIDSDDAGHIREMYLKVFVLAVDRIFAFIAGLETIIGCIETTLLMFFESILAESHLHAKLSIII